jgi:hypothetical protein
MVSPANIEEALHRLYIGAPQASLREEDHKKASELCGLLREIERVVRGTDRRPFRMVDAAAGKAYVGLLAAELVLARESRPGRVTLIEREPRRASACLQAVAAVRAAGVRIGVEERDVADGAAWPREPDLVVALHACGPAADTVAEQAVACRARHLLLVPCCTSKAVASAETAVRRADALGIPRHAEVRRRFIQAVVDSARTLTLEAAGYETTVIPFVPPTITPHNLLWRARRVGEPRRMAAAVADLARLLAP